MGANLKSPTYSDVPRCGYLCSYTAGAFSFRKTAAARQGIVAKRPTTPRTINPERLAISPPTMGKARLKIPDTISMIPKIRPLTSGGVTSAMRAVDVTMAALHPRPTRKIPSVIRM